MDSELLIPVLFPQFPNLNTNRRQTFTLGETHVLSLRAVLESQLSFNRSTLATEVPTPPSEPNPALIAGRDVGSVRVTASSGLPGLTKTRTDRTNPKRFFNNTLQVSSNMAIEQGRHSLDMGAMFQRFGFDTSLESRTRGLLEFRGLLALLDDDPRRIEGASAASEFARDFRPSLLGLYIQDDI